MKKRILIGITGTDATWAAAALEYPGCVAVGKSARQAEKRMAAALVSYIAGMIEDGESLPDDVMKSAIIEVDVPTITPKRQKVNGDLLTTSEAADAYGKTRAAWRQACERGSIPGAVSKGGIWLIPRSGAAEYGKSAKRGRPAKSQGRIVDKC